MTNCKYPSAHAGFVYDPCIDTVEGLCGNDEKYLEGLKERALRVVIMEFDDRSNRETEIAEMMAKFAAEEIEKWKKSLTI